MAEALAALSLLTTIAQLIEYGTKLTSRLRDLASANGEFAGLRTRVTALLGVLGVVKRQLLAASAGRRRDAGDGRGEEGELERAVEEALLPVVMNCVDVVKSILGMVERVMPAAKGKKALLFDKYLRAAKALSMDKEFKRLGQQLAESVQLITLWQTTVLVDLANLDGAKEEDMGRKRMVVKAREIADGGNGLGDAPTGRRSMAVEVHANEAYVESAEDDAEAEQTTTTIVVTSRANEAYTETDSDSALNGPSQQTASCATYCSCVCHRPYELSTPSYLAAWTGHLSISSVGGGRPALRWPCTERRCQRRTTVNTRITYRLPDWLLPVALNLSLSSTALNTRINLNTLRILPDTAEVFSVISRGDLVHLRKMFAANQASVYDVSRSNWSLVHTAFTLGRMDIASFLVKEGADLTICATNGSNVIERAWFHAQKFTNEPGGYVLSDNDILRNIDIDDFVSQQQYTIIHKIVLGLTKLPLEDVLATSTVQIDEQDANGATPMWWAAAQGNLGALGTLLRFGADQDIGAGLHQIPLHVARNAAVAKMLIEAGNGTQVKALDDLGRAPLHCYCYRQVGSNRELVKAVVDQYGAEVNAVAQGGQTPLHYAVMFGNAELVEPLLDAGAELEARMKSGLTPLLAALRYDQSECIALLLDRGADMIASLDDGEGVFHFAARWTGIACFRALANQIEMIGAFALMLEEKDLKRLFMSRPLRLQELDEGFNDLLEILKRRNMVNSCRDALARNSESEAKGPDMRMPGAFG